MRAEVREFLTSRRAQLTPAQVNLPVAANRRVAGLRRSEVAPLAGASVGYDTRIERGASSGCSVRSEHQGHGDGQNDRADGLHHERRGHQSEAQDLVNTEESRGRKGEGGAWVSRGARRSRDRPRCTCARAARTPPGSPRSRSPPERWHPPGFRQSAERAGSTPTRVNARTGGRTTETVLDYSRGPIDGRCARPQWFG